MYRGFNLEYKYYHIDYHNNGRNLYRKTKKRIQDTLENYLSIDGYLDGLKMQEDWFPEVEADVFISHSRQDEQYALTLASWLHNEFGLRSFIDSAVWGYADDLLSIIDDKYCWNPKHNMYEYKKRNRSTSHVHMMLSAALNKMIDKAECLFFLNSPKAVSTSSAMQMTASPWIYSEIAMSKTIRKKVPIRYLRKETIGFSKGGQINEQMLIQYYLDLDHLINININDLDKWHILNDEYGLKSLNALYDLHPLKRKTNG